MHNIELVSPVEVCELPGPPAVTQVIQQALVLSVQADVVGDREGLLGKAGDAIHHIVSVEVQPEVIPVPCLTGHDLHPLEQKTPGKLWRRKEHLTWHTYRAVSEGFPAHSSHCLMPTTLLLNQETAPGTVGHRARCCGLDTNILCGLVWLLPTPLCSTSQVPLQTPGGPGPSNCAGSMTPDPRGPVTSWSSSWSQEGCPGASQTTLDSSVWVTQFNSVQPRL